MNFVDLRLSEPLLRAISREGYDVPTPIQSRAIPPILEGRDVLGSARTGTGKTAAFALPILQQLAASATKAVACRPSALIIAPTRELAAQIQENLEVYGSFLPLRSVVIYGGVGQDPQVRAIRRGAHILVATPGRLLDLIQQRHIDLSAVRHFVLDEADQMFDMGFIHDVRRIVKMLPARRQTLLFSATMPPEIRSLAESILTDPVDVRADPVSTAAPRITQSAYVAEPAQRIELLRMLLLGPVAGRTLVFTRTKHRADRVARDLQRSGISAVAIHGNKSQNARRKAMDAFRSAAPPVLIATDIAARGIDVDDVTHVINFDLPDVPETYVHRIGRTARAGASGSAISFVGREDRQTLRAIERLIGASLEAGAPIESDPAAERVRVAPVQANTESHPRDNGSRRPSRGPRRPASKPKSAGTGGRGSRSGAGAPSVHGGARQGGRGQRRSSAGSVPQAPKSDHGSRRRQQKGSGRRGQVSAAARQ